MLDERMTVLSAKIWRSPHISTPRINTDVRYTGAIQGRSHFQRIHLSYVIFQNVSSTLVRTARVRFWDTIVGRSPGPYNALYCAIVTLDRKRVPARVWQKLWSHHGEIIHARLLALVPVKRKIIATHYLVMTARILFRYSRINTESTVTATAF